MLCTGPPKVVGGRRPSQIINPPEKNLLGGLRCSNAAPRHAVFLKVALRVARASRLTDGTRAGRSTAAGIGIGATPHAALTLVAVVEATCHGCAARAVGRLALGVELTRRALAGQTDVVVNVATGRQLAAAEAIAAVRHERIARRLALRLLHRLQIAAVCRRFGWIVRTARLAARRIVRRDRKRVAQVGPQAFVVARTRITVEVAVLATRRADAQRDPDTQVLLVVVAGTEAFGIFGVDFAISVVVHAVAAVVLSTATLGNDATRRSCNGGSTGARSAAAGSARLEATASRRASRASFSAAGTAIHQRVVDTDFYRLAAAAERLNEQRQRSADER